MSTIRSFLSLPRIRRSFGTFAVPHEHDYFRHTSSTWWFNAQKQHANRFLEFNVSALIDEAIRAANASSCVHFSKLRDETANRLFEIKLDNGQELVAKLPYPFAGPAHYTTASEVATMQFMREFLELPVPNVLAWSSHSDSTPVKSEFIIMEKLKGRLLSEVQWENLTTDEVGQIISKIVEAERRMTDMGFNYLGSLYYTKDIPHNVPSIKLSESPGDELYCIGPSVERRFWRDGRAELNIDRGPWNSLSDYALSVINCEIAWLKKYAKPHRMDSPLFRSERDNDPETHIKLLEKYALVAPFLTPVEEFDYPALWHPDFHSQNILISPVDGSHRLSGILGWQGAHIDLLLVIARSLPQCLDPPSNYIPVELEPGGQLCENPALPDNFHSLSEAQQAEAKKELSAVKRYNGYTILTKEFNPRLHAHRATDEFLFGTMPLLFASETWNTGTAFFENTLICICDAWKNLISPRGEECPISFSESEIAANKTALKRLAQVYKPWVLCSKWGFDIDGEVHPDKIKETQKTMEVVRERYLQSLPESEREDARRQWPFQDGALSVTAETSQTPQIHRNLNHAFQ